MSKIPYLLAWLFSAMLFARYGTHCAYSAMRAFENGKNRQILTHFRLIR